MKTIKLAQNAYCYIDEHINNLRNIKFEICNTLALAGFIFQLDYRT